MAMAVLVEFDDDKKAKAFVEKVNGSYGLPSIQAHARGRKAVGVWKLPTKWCECFETGVKRDISGYSRGPKYGWWVHSCGRPSKFWSKARYRLWEALGKNLLPGAQDPDMDPQVAHDHDNLMRDDLEAVGMPLTAEQRRKKRRKNRPRRGDGTVSGH